MCPASLPIQGTFYAITKVGNNKAIVIITPKLPPKCNHLFEVELTKDKTDISVKELKASKMRRAFHITFTLNGSLYMAGGEDDDYNILSSCERYDQNKKLWVDCKHTLPYPMCGASVVVSAYDTYAVITGGLTKRPGLGGLDYAAVLVFTEGEGFQYVSKL